MAEATRTQRWFCSLVLLAALTGAAGAQEKQRVVVDGSTTVGPIAKAFREYFLTARKDYDISVSESGSGNGAKALLNGTCDVADMSRNMKDAEFKAAVEKGLQPVAHAIAIDGLAVIVHPSNPVKELTLAQLKSIYTGKTTNWKELGGPDLKIVKISRDTNSGTFETFNHFVLGEDKVAADTETVGSNGAAQQRVKSTPAALAYVGLGFVDAGVKALAVEKVAPERAAVASGKYPLARPLFMYTNGYPKLGSAVHAFVTLHLTPKGQEIIEELGFIPLTHYGASGGEAPGAEKAKK